MVKSGSEVVESGSEVVESGSEVIESVESVERVEGFHWIYIILNLCVYVFMCFLPHLYKSLLVLLG